MALRKIFIGLSCVLLLTHLVHSLIIGTPWIGILIWSAPLLIFTYRAWLNPTARLFQIFGFIVLIYFMMSCLIVFGLPNPSVLSWLELILIVTLFFVGVYTAREFLNVK